MAEPINASIVQHVPTVEDPRRERTQPQALLESLIVAVCPLLTAGEGFQDMALCGQRKRAWLPTFLALPPGMPSHETCGRVCTRLNSPRFQACCLPWTPAVAPLTQGTLVSLDGTTVTRHFSLLIAPQSWLKCWASPPAFHYGSALPQESHP